MAQHKKRALLWIKSRLFISLFFGFFPNKILFKANFTRQLSKIQQLFLLLHDQPFFKATKNIKVFESSRTFSLSNFQLTSRKKKISHLKIKFHFLAGIGIPPTIFEFENHGRNDFRKHKIFLGIWTFQHGNTPIFLSFLDPFSRHKFGSPQIPLLFLVLL